MEQPPKNFGRTEPSRICFGDKLSALCAMELSAARERPEIIAEMIERLCNSLAFTIVIGAKADSDGIDKMLTGATSYLYEAASDHAPVARALEKIKRTR